MFFSNLRSLREHRITPIPGISSSVMLSQEDFTALIQAHSDTYVFLLSVMQNLTFNLASHITMSSSPLLVRIHSLFNTIIFMYFS